MLTSLRFDKGLRRLWNEPDILVIIRTDSPLRYCELSMHRMYAESSPVEVIEGVAPPTSM